MNLVLAAGESPIIPRSRELPLGLVYRLHHLVALQPFLAAFTAEARVLDPAERRVGDRNGESVDPNHAAFDEVADEVGAAAVLGESEGGEAEGQAVGLTDHFLERVERARYGDGAERLLVHDRRFVRHIGEQGWLEEEPAVAFLAAGQDARALRLGILD